MAKGKKLVITNEQGKKIIIKGEMWELFIRHQIMVNLVSGKKRILKTPEELDHFREVYKNI